MSTPAEIAGGGNRCRFMISAASAPDSPGRSAAPTSPARRHRSRANPRRPHRPTAAGSGRGCRTGDRTPCVERSRMRSSDSPRSGRVAAAHRDPEPSRRWIGSFTPPAGDRAISPPRPLSSGGRIEHSRWPWRGWRIVAGPSTSPREPGDAIPTPRLDEPNGRTRAPPTALATDGSTDRNRTCPPPPGWRPSPVRSTRRLRHRPAPGRAPAGRPRHGPVGSEGLPLPRRPRGPGPGDAASRSVDPIQEIPF